MKYTQEMSEKLVADYTTGRSVDEMAVELNVPKRSVIAKLSSLGVYKAKTYVNKRGEQPVKKEQHIVKIAQMLGIDVNLLDSMEKVTKTALVLIEEAVKKILLGGEAEVQYWKDEAKFIEDKLIWYEKHNKPFLDMSELDKPGEGHVSYLPPFKPTVEEQDKGPQKLVGPARDDPSTTKLSYGDDWMDNVQLS